MTTPSDESRRARLAAFNARLRACRRCHAAGFLDERESVPVGFDAEPDAPVPRILLIGQAPGLQGAGNDRPFAGASGDRLRAWFEAGGIPPEDFWRKIHFAAVTRCYPGRIPGARGDRLPSPGRAGPLPPLARRAGRPDPARGRPPGRPAGDPDGAGAGAVALGGRRDRPGRRGRPLSPAAPPLGGQPMAQRPGRPEAVARAMVRLRGWVEELESDGLARQSSSIRSRYSIKSLTALVGRGIMTPLMRAWGETPPARTRNRPRTPRGEHVEQGDFRAG